METKDGRFMVLTQSHHTRGKTLYLRVVLADPDWNCVRVTVSSEERHQSERQEKRLHKWYTHNNENSGKKIL